jgi:CRP/FNR family transcriptional regulator, cyclic AMP receptor protein
MPGRAALFGSHNLLSGLPPEYSSRLLVNAPAIDLTKGQALFQIGAPADGCYWLNKGVLKVSITSNQGAERILAILGPGSIVGELALIDGLPRSASVQALRDSRLTFVSRNHFRECLRESPKLYALLVDTLVARLRHADEEAAAASFLSLKARVARALLQFAKHLGEPTATPDQVIVRNKIRQEDLAALADVARENANRILSEWRKRKIIVRQSPSVYVIHKSKVEREAGLAGKDWSDLIVCGPPARPAPPPPAMPASSTATTESIERSVQSKAETGAIANRTAGRTG